MSCCCSNPSQALIGAAIVTLVVFVPVGFYQLVDIVFHFDELTHQALSIVSTITCVGAVLLAILALIGRGTKNTAVLGSTFWLGICWTSFAVAMTIWGATVQAQSSTGLENSITSTGVLVILSLGFILSPLSWLTYEAYALRQQLRTNPDDVEQTNHPATQMQLQEKQSMAAELSKPYGRRSRGRKEHSYERAYSSESSESEEAAPQRKRRGPTRG